MPALDVIRSTDRKFLYLDPPCFVAGPGLYTHPMSMRDHRALATTLREFGDRRRWLLSYDECPPMRRLYGEWADIERIGRVSETQPARKTQNVLISQRLGR